MNVFVALVFENWWLDSFRSLVDYVHATEIFVGVFNTFINMLFSISRLIWQALDILLGFLGDTTGLKGLISEIFKVSSVFYKTLYSSYISNSIIFVIYFCIEK